MPDYYIATMYRCPVITTMGRTFPVQQLFLEDVYRLTQYRLAPDSPAALRGSNNAALRDIKRVTGGSK